MKRVSIFFTVACLFFACQHDSILQSVSAQRAEAPRFKLDPTRIKIPAKAQPIMALKDVRVGMRGYGLSVFHGTKIETFSFVVVSIEHSSSPDRGVIWVRCDDDRMQKTGPVSGMSGSPMYIWPEGVQKVLGENGLLIGAFAYGYRLSKDCYAGVQPIEHMREVAERVSDKKTAYAAGAKPATQATATAIRDLNRQLNLTNDWRLESLARIHERMPHQGVKVTNQQAQHERSSPITLHSAPQQANATSIVRDQRQLPLPLSGFSQETASLFEDVLSDRGLLPVMSSGMNQKGLVNGSSSPFDMSKVKLEPGSLITVPLAVGDADLSAAGTVTDVLPDGTVLAFGHAMDNIGDSVLPVATGFVHFIQPQLTNSFKMSGSSTLAGTLLRDEQSAIAVRGQKNYGYAPMDVTVAYAGEPSKTYKYQLAIDPGYTPMLASAVAARSISAYRGLPAFTTIDGEFELTFTKGKKIQFSRRFAGKDLKPLTGAIISPIMSAMNNGFENLQLLSAKVNLKVLPTLELASISNARLEKTILKPGELLGVRISMRPFQKPDIEKRLTLKLPEDLKPGQYRVSIVDGSGYNQLIQANQPHRLSSNNMSQYWQAISRLLTIPSDTLSLVVMRNEVEIAIGQSELPDLPPSKRALFVAGHSTTAKAYKTWIEKSHKLPWVVRGGISYTITVEKPDRP